MNINLNQTLNQVVDIISKIYYNFNGIINHINIAGGLIILPYYNNSNTDISLGAKLATTNGYIVKIYPLNIIAAYPDPILPAIFTTLHELSHMDQNIDFYKYRTDSSYVEDIEVSNNKNTYEFIINNEEFICSIIGNGFKINPKELKEIACVFPNSNNKNYEKISIQQVYSRAFEYLCNLNGTNVPNDSLISPLALTRIDTVIFKIKDMDATTATIYIKKNGTFYNTSVFNMLMYYYIYQYDMVNYTLDTSLKYDKLEIRLNIKKKMLRPFVLIH